MSAMSGTRSHLAVATRLGAALLVLAGAGAALVAPAAAAGSATEPRTTWQRIGTSVQGRPITVAHRAWPGATAKVLVIGSIHGDERAGLRVYRDLRTRALPRSVDLYLMRTANPDGVAADRRTNAHRVDLNRNFPYRFHADGRGTETYSGPRALSEPETRALRAFVLALEPDLVITFHQPLYGVGANDKGMPVVRAIAKGTGLPLKNFACSGVCYGTFTSWVNHRTPGLAVTVEFGRTASDYRIRRAARTVLSVGATL